MDQNCRNLILNISSRSALAHVKTEDLSHSPLHKEENFDTERSVSQHRQLGSKEIEWTHDYYAIFSARWNSTPKNVSLKLCAGIRHLLRPRTFRITPYSFSANHD